MLRVNLLVFLMLGVVGSAVAQEEAKKPKAPPPEFVTVAAMDKSKALLDLEYTVDVGVQYMRIQSEYEVDGTTRTAEIVSPKPILKRRVLKLKLKHAEVSDARGNKLETKEVWERLAVGDTVVIPVDDQPVDAAYLRVLANDTLVIVSPQCAEWRRGLPLGWFDAMKESPFKGPTKAERQLEEDLKDLPGG